MTEPPPTGQDGGKGVLRGPSSQRSRLLAESRVQEDMGSARPGEEEMWGGRLQGEELGVGSGCLPLSFPPSSFFKIFTCGKKHIKFTISSLSNCVIQQCYVYSRSCAGRQGMVNANQARRCSENNFGCLSRLPRVPGEARLAWL